MNITIVTGTINSFKTQRLLKIAKQQSHVDGYIAIKTMQENNVHSYYALRLKTHTTELLAMHENFYRNHFNNTLKHGPYYFNVDAFKTIEQVLVSLSNNDQIKTVIIDEIGQLEVQNKGFHHALQTVIKSHKNIVISVSKKHLKKVINHYQFDNPKIIE